MSERPLISVIVPVYNTIEYIHRCVKSICSQTYENLEIILVDDGSTDGTGELCDRLASEDERIVVFHKSNSGSSGARNYALSRAKGEYFGFVDSDDYISEDMYERLYDGIVRYDALMAQIGRDEIDSDGKKLPDICTPPDASTFIESKDFFKELLMHRGDCSFCTKLVSGKLFDKMRFPEGFLNEDFKLLIEMLPGMKGLVSLPGQTYHVYYRIGSNSRKASKNDFSRVYMDCVNNADYATEIERKYFNAQLDDCALRFGAFQRLEYLLHIPIPMMTSDNSDYKKVVKWLRNNYFRTLFNRLLTGKNKLYITLFAIAPKTVRVLHKKIKHL